MEPDTKPVYQQYRPIPKKHEQLVRETIENLLKLDVIEPSESNWASNVLFVKKPNGTFRMCIDLRAVNSHTCNFPRWPISYAEESYVGLCNAKYRSNLDLANAYWAIELETEQDKQKTAFHALGNLYQWKRSPFGAKSIPQTFNRLMSKVLYNCHQFSFSFFDDIIVFSHSFKEHLVHLDIIFQRLIAAGLKLRIHKCFLGLTPEAPMKWLGSIIVNNHIQCDPEKVNAISKLPAPNSKKAVQKFLGAINFHRRFIPDFGRIAAPLYKVTPAKATFVWKDVQQKAFEQLKQALCTAPALSLPDMNQHFILSTDASDAGIGVTLSQAPFTHKNFSFLRGERSRSTDTSSEKFKTEQTNAIVFAVAKQKTKVEKSDVDWTKEAVVAYASRSFNANEQNRLTTPEKELLGILYGAVTFWFYLMGNHFTLRTDARCLTFCKKFKDTNTRIYKAALLLEELSFDIQHCSAKRGNLMQMCDFLSREHECIPRVKHSYKVVQHPAWEHLKAPKAMVEGKRYSLKEVYDLTTAQDLGPDPTEVIQEEKRDDPLSKYVNLLTQVVESQCPPRTRKMESVNLTAITEPMFTEDTLVVMQRADNNLKPIINKLIAKEVVVNYQLVDQLLVKVVKDPLVPAQTRVVPVIPQSMVEPLLRHYHGNLVSSHAGTKKMIALVKAHFYWESMVDDITKFVKECTICQHNRPYTGPKQPFRHLRQVERPNEQVSMDVVGPIQTSVNGNKYILTMVDEFTKFAIAAPLPDKSTKEIMHVVLTYWFTTIGTPRYLHSDAGKEVDSELVRNVCKLLAVRKVRTPGYAPYANGANEAFNKTLGLALNAWLPQADAKHWETYLPFIITAYNSIPHSQTKVEPLRLMRGDLYVNAFVPAIDLKNFSPSSPLSELTHLRSAQELLWSVVSKNRPKNTGELNNKFKEGDYVLVKVHVFQPLLKKFSSKWKGPYRVIRVYDGLLLCAPYIDSEDAVAAEDKLLRVSPQNVKPFYGQMQELEWTKSFADKFIEGLQEEIETPQVSQDPAFEPEDLSEAPEEHEEDFDRAPTLRRPVEVASENTDSTEHPLPYRRPKQLDVRTPADSRPVTPAIQPTSVVERSPSETNPTLREVGSQMSETDSQASRSSRAARLRKPPSYLSDYQLD
jgi:hypothetical protein